MSRSPRRAAAPTLASTRPRPPLSGRPTVGRSRGQALVELALVVPMLLLLLVAAIDLGRLFYSRITVANAAREGAFVAAYDPTSFSSGSACNAASNRIMCAVTRESTSSFVTIVPADVTVACTPSCATGSTPANRVTVTVTGHFNLLTPLLAVFTGGQNVTFASAATADIVNIPGPSGGGSPTPTPSPTPSPTGSASPTPTPTPSPTPTCNLPAPGFTTSQQNRNRPVVFTSFSTPTSGVCAITFWRWEYGDGDTDAGNLPSASHDYNSSGRTFQATLTVTNPAGVASVTQTVVTK